MLENNCKKTKRTASKHNWKFDRPFKTKSKCFSIIRNKRYNFKNYLCLSKRYDFKIYLCLSIDNCTEEPKKNTTFINCTWRIAANLHVRGDLSKGQNIFLKKKIIFILCFVSKHIILIC